MSGADVHARVLVTGGAGFVARRLSIRLLADGYKVRATYRGKLPDGVDTRIDWVRIQDVGSDTDWSAALVDVDIVFHLAAIAHRLQASQASLADEYHRVNALGTRRLAESLVQRGGRARIVFLSSIGAVCSLRDETIRSDTPEHPDTHYGRSKLLGEKLLAEACKGTAVEWCAVRAPLVYGPGAPGNMQRLINATRRGWPLPLARARAKRSMIFVENLVDALVLCSRAPNAANATLLVADQESVSVAELLTLIAQLQGGKSRLFSLPKIALKTMARLLDAVSSSAADASGRYSNAVDLLFGGLTIDTSELRREFHWQAPYSLRDGMAITLGSAPHKVHASSHPSARSHMGDGK